MVFRFLQVQVILPQFSPVGIILSCLPTQFVNLLSPIPQWSKEIMSNPVTSSEESPFGEDEVIFRPLMQTGRAFYIIVAILSIIVALGVYAYIVQLQSGLITTDMRDRQIWGIYIVNFVFFIGISHAGTLISAILRVTGAEWRRPVTRMAEAITVFALIFGALMPIIDLGRPDRVLNVLTNPHISSPILWDFLSIATYLSGSILYLYLPLIPDLAACRDNLPNAAWPKRMFYKIGAMGWKGTEDQKRRLELGISIMAVLIIPIAVSVHTVVSWIFSMTLRPGWRSTIFGPYFVIGAIFSGLATLMIVMWAFRKAFHLEDYITEEHFKNLGLLFLVFDVGYIYFTISEYLTIAYGSTKEDAELLFSLIVGQYSIYFWIFVVLGLIVPAIILTFPKTRTITGIVVSGVLVDIGMYMKRYVITVPSSGFPLMGGDFAPYTPSLVELAITIGSFAGFMLLFLLFAKFFPLISLWEVQEGRHLEMAAKVPVPAPEGEPSIGTPGAIVPGREGP